MESLLVKLQAFAKNDCERVCEGACFYFHAVVVCFLVNCQVFTIKNNNGVCGRTCFYLHVVTESVFSKPPGLYYNLLLWQVIQINIESVAMNTRFHNFKPCSREFLLLLSNEIWKVNSAQSGKLSHISQARALSSQ